MEWPRSTSEMPRDRESDREIPQCTSWASEHAMYLFSAALIKGWSCGSSYTRGNQIRQQAQPIPPAIEEPVSTVWWEKQKRGHQLLRGTSGRKAAASKMCTMILNFSHEFWKLDSAPYASMAITLPTEPSPEPRKVYVCLLLFSWSSLSPGYPVL